MTSAVTNNAIQASSNAAAVQSNKIKPKTKTTVELTDQTNLLPVRQVVIVFLALSLCALVTSLDSLIVSTSLPTVSAVFNAGSVSSWVPSAYLLTSTAFQPLYGRLSDIFGRKSTLCLAMTVYFVGNLAAGFSNSIIQLIVCRGIAGAGGGGISSMLQIMISDIVPLRERGKYVGISAGVIALGYAFGPIIGGVLAEKASWRWCFWVTLPLSVVATIMAMIFAPFKPMSGGIVQKLKIIDYPGIVLTLGGCTLIMLPLIWGGITYPWNSVIVLAPLCCGVFVVVLFCLWEWKVAKLPIVPMHIFKHVTVVGVYICMFANGFVFFSALYYLPLFFQVVLGYSPTYSGTFLLPVVMSQVVSSLTAGLTVSHTGKYRTVVYTGFALSAIGCGCISIFNASTSKAVMVVLMLLTGFGNGMTMQTTTVAAQASVARKDMSIVTAVRNFVRMLGGAIALPVASSLLNNAIRDFMKNLGFPSSTISPVIDKPSLLNNPSAISSLSISPSQAADILSKGYTKGFRDVFLLNAAMSATATLVSVVMIKHKELLRGDEERLRKEAAEALQTAKTKVVEKESI
ncbi:major facilitator superfamily-domain-containing protein [Lentinula edodes]|uniref:major facilitator superfamily-domain-containing protein n=1 Tax=Lentinula edodes TaxID=5353 RepID=UPI001E8DD756|nr:major facilitator superfamily-domain-containing protein [Lentinula edodes]KAH7874842.1 major facilitator superfamily-domain-containing protein [Lentinula edodes]